LSCFIDNELKQSSAIILCRHYIDHMTGNGGSAMLPYPVHVSQPFLLIIFIFKEEK